MKLFSVGYQVMSGDPDYFADIVGDYREHIREVYFARPGAASGRAAVDVVHAPQMEAELKAVRGMGIKLNLLFNASCYGAGAALPVHTGWAVRQTEKALKATGLDGITTMSPVIARAVKRAFPDLDVRASVNMRLGTVEALRYAAGYFDSFYVRREYNRDPERLQQLQKWAADNGKTLHMLANSGCLYTCPFQTFHDNLVAHGSDAEYVTGCRAHYADPANLSDFFRSTWIRPEDIDKHHTVFTGGYKLATRKHDNPRLVIHAYATGKFYGNLPDLMEPGFGPHWHPAILDNTRFPKDWFERTFGCGRQCDSCGFCDRVSDMVRINTGHPEPVEG